jgi:hypothetical protein
MLAELEIAGGPVPFFEMRAALDATSYEVLLQYRDEARTHWNEVTSLIASPLGQKLAEQRDDPSQVGGMISLGILTPLALSLRHVNDLSGTSEVGGKSEAV